MTPEREKRIKVAKEVLELLTIRLGSREKAVQALRQARANRARTTALAHGRLDTSEIDQAGRDSKT